MVGLIEAWGPTAMIVLNTLLIGLLGWGAYLLLFSFR